MYSELLWQFQNLPANYVALDTETTGLFDGDNAPDIISIGLCHVKNKKIHSSDYFEVKPKKLYSNQSEKIHGIPWQESQTYPDLGSSWNDIHKLLNGQLIVIHNSLFDWRVVAQAASNENLALPKVDGVFCSQRAAQPWAMANAILCSERGPSLNSLQEALKIVLDRSIDKRPHNSEKDAKLVVAVVEKLRRYPNFNP